MRRQALIVEANGERFRFYYDLEDSNVLHITRQHGTTPEEAIQTYLLGRTGPWDATHLRFETYAQTHGLFWTRHAHDQSVIVISCFRLGDE